MSVKLNTKYLANYVNPDELTGIRHEVEASAKMLHEKSGFRSLSGMILRLPTVSMPFAGTGRPGRSWNSCWRN